MNLKQLPATRISPDETLVIVPDRVLSAYQVTRLNEVAERVGVKLLILPSNTKVYVQESAA